MGKKYTTCKNGTTLHICAGLNIWYEPPEA
nr:MAG TPA: hypothetical protein [Caudoviricetes sp.]